MNVALQNGGTPGTDQEKSHIHATVGITIIVQWVLQT